MPKTDRTANKDVKIKGITLISRLAFIEKEFSKEAHEQAIAELRKSFGDVTVGAILPLCWYPLAMDDLLCRFIQKSWNLPEDEAYFRLGQRSAQESKKTFSIFFTNCTSPLQVLERMPQLHKHFVEDMGRMVYEPVTNDQVLLHLEDLAIVYRSHCISTMGFIAEACLLYTGKAVEARHLDCKARGKSRCTFLFQLK